MRSITDELIRRGQLNYVCFKRQLLKSFQGKFVWHTSAQPSCQTYIQGVFSNTNRSLTKYKQPLARAMKVGIYLF